MDSQLSIVERRVAPGFKIFLTRVFKNRKRTLDVGCGTGAYLDIFSVNSVGIDINIANLRVCRRKELTVLRANINEGLPFMDKSFDTVLLSHVLEHIEAPIQLLRETYRILYDGGILVIGLPVENSLADLLGKNYYYKGHNGHIYSFTLENTTVLLQKTGFTMKSKPVIEPWPDQKLHRMRLLNCYTHFLQWLPFLVSIFCSNGYWIIAQKIRR